MENFWDKLRNGIKEGAVASAEKVELYSKIGKLKIDQFSLKKKIESSYNDIGMRVYDLVKDGKADSAGTDIAVEGFMKKIDEHQLEIEAIGEEIEAIKLEKETGSDAIGSDDNEEEVLGV